MTKPASKLSPDQNMLAREQMKQRMFPPKQRNTFLQTLRYAIRIKSDADLPKVFQLPVAVALKPGSQEELATRFKVPENKTDPRRSAFESAMAMYCRSSQYGHALLTCDQLFSIDMKPAGPPGNEDRELGQALTGTLVRNKSHVIPRPPSGANNPAPTPKRSRMDKSVSGSEAGQPAGQPEAQAKPEQPAEPVRPTRSPRERQQFHPVQRQRILDGFCRVFGVDSEAELPAYLLHDIAVPLQVGYSRKLSERYNVPRRGKDPRAGAFGTAMTRYTNSRAYQHALLNCETRFTIDMTPAEPITDEDREQAIITLRELNRRKSERMQSSTLYIKRSRSGPKNSVCGDLHQSLLNGQNVLSEVPNILPSLSVELQPYPDFVI